MEEEKGSPQKQKRAHQIVENLLSKPSKKPDFASFQPPEILKRAQAFLPAFISNTDKILANPELLKSSQMDVKISEGQAFNPATQEKEFQQMQKPMADGQANAPSVINMDIGVGIFDVQESQQTSQSGAASTSQSNQELPPGMGYHQTSTTPILRMVNDKDCDHQSGEDSSSESSSGDEDRFMQFDGTSSDEEIGDDSKDKAAGNQEEEMVDAQSFTTGSSTKGTTKVTKSKKRPLIQELASIEFDPKDQCEDVVIGQKRLHRDTTKKPE